MGATPLMASSIVSGPAHMCLILESHRLMHRSSDPELRSVWLRGLVLLLAVVNVHLGFSFLYAPKARSVILLPLLRTDEVMHKEEVGHTHWWPIPDLDPLLEVGRVLLQTDLTLLDYQKCARAVGL